MERNIKKDITFICTDNVERQCLEPISLEAEKRGYKVRFSENKFEKCEIGFYISHWNFPKYSKLSVVSLHDLGQQHGEWPMPWKLEYWNIFDVAFLPSKEWADMWHNASCYDFVRPRIGTFFTGFPKADRIQQKSFSENCKEIISKYGIDKNKKTALYAPSWEWDGRQLEMIAAVKDLNVNLIIKQFPYMPPEFAEQYEIIKDMNEKSKGKPNVYILDSSINIYDAINLCDVLVSEESSTLYEAMLMGKPVVAVTDWLVPDVKPPRLPEFPYDFAIKISKNKLKETIFQVLEDKKYLEKIKNYREINFPQIGNASKNVMDVIDSIVNKTELPETKIEELELTNTPPEFKKSVAKRKWTLKKYNFAHTSKFGEILYRFYHLLKLKCQNQSK